MAFAIALSSLRSSKAAIMVFEGQKMETYLLRQLEDVRLHIDDVDVKFSAHA